MFGTSTDQQGGIRSPAPPLHKHAIFIPHFCPCCFRSPIRAIDVQRGGLFFWLAPKLGRDQTVVAPFTPRFQKAFQNFITGIFSVTAVPGKKCEICTNVEAAQRRATRWIVFPDCTNFVPRPHTWWHRRTAVPKSILKYFCMPFFSHGGRCKKMMQPSEMVWFQPRSMNPFQPKQMFVVTTRIVLECHDDTCGLRGT
jgi:hypothetical protein